MAMTTLQWPDYLILVAFLAISLGIGFYHSVTGGRQKTIQEFIMANRKLGILPTALSLFVSFQSAIMMLGATVEMYMFGVQYLVWIPVSFTISTIFVERLFVPWIYPLKLVSINDYLEQRFESRAVRILGAFIGILTGVVIMGVAMYAPSAALEIATGLPTTVSIPLMAIVSIAYTALGGMRAVIWTDVFQFVIMMGGMLAILIKGLVVTGGFQSVLDVCNREGRLNVANWSPDPTVRHTVWGLTIGWSIHWMKVYGLNQASVQRYSATETLSKARVTVLMNIPGLVVLYFIACAIGLTVFAYYASIRCDPLVNGDVSNANQLLSLFVTSIFTESKGFAGLFLATLYGGALSSISSALSGTAANCWDDILQWKLSGMQEQRKALLNRMLVVIFGAASTGLGFLAAVTPGPITQVVITFSSAVGGPLYGIYVLGGATKYANWKGALAGGIGCLCINLWMNVGAFMLKRRLPVLPPASIDGCHELTSMFSANATSLFSMVTADAVNGGLFNHVASTSYDHTLDSTSVPALATQTVATLTGLQKFYSISYIWYTTFSVVITFVIGMIVSLIFRDREAEARVADRLLIPFHQFFSWSQSTHLTKENHSDGQNRNDQTNNNKEESSWMLQDVEVKVQTDIAGVKERNGQVTVSDL